MTGLEPGSPLVETTALPAVPHQVRINTKLFKNWTAVRLSW